MQKNFQQNLSKNYGIDLLVKIREKLNEYTFNNDIEQINILQNELLDICYNEKFNKIDKNKHEELLKYLKDLKEFEKVRGIYEKDSVFKDFYNEKFGNILKIFEKNGFDKEQLFELKYSDEYVKDLISKNSNNRRKEKITNTKFASNILKLMESENFNYSNYEICSIQYGNRTIRLLRNKENFDIIKIYAKKETK